MLLNLKIKIQKNRLNKYVKKYGVNDERTIKLSKQIDDLINKYYKKYSK